MWLLLAPQPRPDAPYWPGRCLMAAVDAATWPLLWVLLISKLQLPVGLAGPFVAAVAVLCGIDRLYRALWMNHRYRFTTSRWGRLAAALMLTGAVLKLMLPG